SRPSGVARNSANARTSGASLKTMKESAEPSAPLLVSEIVGNGKIPMSPSSPMVYFESPPLVRRSGKKSGPYQTGIFCIQQPGLAVSSVNIGSITVLRSLFTIWGPPPSTAPSLNRSEPTLSKAALILGSSKVILWLTQSAVTDGSSVLARTSSTQSVSSQPVAVPGPPALTQNGWLPAAVIVSASLTRSSHVFG